MFAFTQQEKTVIAVFILVTLLGSSLHYALKKYPALSDIVNLIDSDAIYSKVDINTASFDELVSLPYIGEYTAANIIRYRSEFGPFQDIEQIKKVKGIRSKNFEKFRRQIMVVKPE